MKSKEIIIIVLLIVVIAILVKVMQIAKVQTQAIADITKTINPNQENQHQRHQQRTISQNQSSQDRGKKSISENNSDSEDDDDDDNNEDGKSVKLKKVHKQILALFGDNIPKTVIQLRQLYNEKYEKQLDNIKFTNTMWALKTKGVVNTEKVDGGNWWGLKEWFENDSQEGEVFLEEYLQKIPEPEEPKKKAKSAKSIETEV